MSVDQITVSDQQEQLTALVSVFDPAGRSVDDITDFSASIDGTTVPIGSASPIVEERSGISVLFLIDTSGSMEGAPLAQARDAVKTLAGGLLSKDAAGVITFAGTVQGGTGFSSDHAALLGMIDELRTEPGGTALYDAIAQGLAVSQQARTDRRAIVLLTDGGESGASTVSRQAVLDSVAIGNVPVFSIGLGNETDALLLQDVARASKGSFYYAPTPADLSEVFDVLAGHLGSHYEIVLGVPRATLTSRTLVIETRIGPALLSAEAHFVTNVPATSSTKGAGTNRWIWLGAVLFAMPILTLAAWRYRPRRRATPSPLPGGPGQDAVLPRKGPSQRNDTFAPRGRLTVLEGPGLGASIEISHTPVHIGGDPGCELRLEAGNSLIPMGRVRAWLQNDRLIIHRMAPAAMGGKSDVSLPEWSSFEPEETFRIGPCLLAFRLESTPSQSA